MSENKTFLLKSGNVISEELYFGYIAILKTLFLLNAIALRDLVLHCRNPERQMSPVNVRLMIGLDILKPDGTPYPVFKDFVLCAVEEDGIKMKIVDPRENA